MSTKIYYGCRLAVGTDLFDFTFKLRDVFFSIYDDVVSRFTVLYACKLVQGARQRGEDLPRDPLWEGFCQFDAYQRQSSFRLTEFEVAFSRDPVTSRIHARPFMDANHYINAWYALPEVESYGYWNNTDQPDDISDLEWEERRASWNRVFGNDPISERSLIFTLVEFGPEPKRLRFPHNELFGLDSFKRESVINLYVEDIRNSGVLVRDLLGNGTSARG